MQATEFAITDIKIYVPVVTLSTQDMQKYYNNWNQGLKEQYFLFFENSAGKHIILSSKSRNKKLQCYYWWRKRFSSTSKEFKNIW